MHQKVAIWVIDNDPNIGDLINRAFNKENLDCDLSTFTTPEELMAQLENKPPALLMVDYRMPKMDGFELIQWIRAHADSEELKIVVFSSNKTDYLLEQSQLMGIHLPELNIALIREKPFDFSGWRGLARELCQEGHLS